MVKVVLRKSETQRQLFRRFKKTVSHSGVMSQVRKRRWFVSKNEQRRLAKRKAIQRLKRNQRKFTSNPKRRKRRK